MLTVGALVRRSGPLRLAAAEGEGREVTGVWAAEGEGPHARREGWTDLLAIVTRPLDPDRCTELMTELARGGAAGVVSVVPAGGVLLSAARHHRLPVVEAVGCTNLYLAQLVGDARGAETGRAVQEADADAERQRLLVDLACGKKEDPTGLLRWLVEAIGGQRYGQAHLIAPHGRPPAVRGGLVLPHARIAALAQGTAASDSQADAGSGWGLWLFGLGKEVPRPVLAVAHRGDWPPSALRSVTQAQEVLALWQRQRQAEEDSRARMRATVLQILMTGRVDEARRVAGPMKLSRAVLRAEAIQVCVIRGRASRREHLDTDLTRLLADDALVAAGDDAAQVVIVYAHGDDDVRGALRRLLDDDPSLYLGAGRPAPLDAVADGVREARAALVAAMDTPGRWAVYTPAPDIASALPGAEAHRWARDLLAPLGAWPPEQRTLYVEATRLHLAYGTVAAAPRARRTLAAAERGVDRNTVRNRYLALSEAVGLDYEQLGDRVVLDLALRIDALRLRTPAYTGPPVTLDDLLHTKEARDWAEGMRTQLGDELMDALMIWLECGMHVARTATRLHVGPKMVRSHLRRAEALRGRLLITPAGRAGDIPLGIHDLILAAYVAGAPSAPSSAPVLTPHHLGR